MKEWKSSPLPFQGQKRFFVKKFKEALRDFPPDAVYVDLFGGSGLLSHTVRRTKPDATVIYNDYDNFSKRLAAIPETNKLLQQLRDLNLKTPRGKRITGQELQKVVDVLKEADNAGYVDWISLSGSLKFSMNYGKSLEDFESDTLYNTIRKSDFADASGYLQGVEIVRMDYRDLYEKYKDIGNVVFLVDPPYLSTDTSTYMSDGYWTLSDYLDVVNVLDGSYFYFTSNKSQIVELMQWVESRTPNSSPFVNATCTIVKNSVTHNATYQDIMYHYNNGRSE